MPDKKQNPGEILVGMDGSLPAQRTGKLAIQIASNLNLSIRGIYVVEDEFFTKRNSASHAESTRDRELKNRRDSMDRLRLKGESCLTWLEKQCQIANVSMTRDLFYGSVTEVLTREASVASMLALGKRGEGHKRDTHTLGSNFRAIINRVRKPLLVGGERKRPLRKILFIEKSRRDISKTLTLVVSLQRSIHSGLIGLDIQKNNIAMQAGLSEIMTEFHEIGITDYLLIGHAGRSVAEIAATARRNSADLIVMRIDRSPAMLKWLTGSTLGGFLMAMTLPMLLIHEYGLIHKIDFGTEDRYVVHT